VLVVSSVIASEAKQSIAAKKAWIASSQGLLAMTELIDPAYNHFVILGRANVCAGGLRSTAAGRPKAGHIY
jgi:hypothetical protein